MSLLLIGTSAEFSADEECYSMNMGENRGPGGLNPVGAKKTLVSIHERLDQWCSTQPDKLLYSFLNRQGESIDSFTYSEFQNRIALISSHLSSNKDLHSGDRLLLLYSPGLEMICALFACSKAGLIAVPAPPPTSHGFQSSVIRLSHIAQDANCSAILLGSTVHNILTENFAQTDQSGDMGIGQVLRDLNWITSDDMLKPVVDAPSRLIHEILFLQYTSGSTNQPKGVMVTHENILHNCSLVVDHENPIAVTWLPQHHDMGLIGYYIFMALAGGTTYGFSPASFMQRPSLWLETISKYRATATSAPNFAFELCLHEKRIPQKTLDKLDLSSLKVLMAAAEPIKVETYRKFRQKFEGCALNPESFFVAYGLAEFTLAVSFYGRDFLSLSQRHLSRGVVKSIESASQITDTTHLISCGTPLGDTDLRIVDPENRVECGRGQIGEIWIAGKSKCLGYWNRGEVSRDVFNANISGVKSREGGYLRTGDMGFLDQGELYVCGRQKDMIIVRGQNFYPQDVENVVEQRFSQTRNGCSAAFEMNDGKDSSAAIVVEVTKRDNLPDARELMRAVAEDLNLRLTRVVFVAPRSVAKTSSGKIRRFKTRDMLVEGELDVLADHRFDQDQFANEDGDLSELMQLKERYNLTGTEDFTLLDAGIDSFDLVVFLHWLKEIVAERGSHLLSEKIDAKMLGAVKISEIFLIADMLDKGQDDAITQMRQLMMMRYQAHLDEEKAMMQADRLLQFEPVKPEYDEVVGPAKSIFLTGGTGFLGPFLLGKLLDQTNAKISVLVRAKDNVEALERVKASITQAFGSDYYEKKVEARVEAICGDLNAARLGLNDADWQRLTSDVDTIYHNGAIVNYLLDYRRMRNANVTGTNEILKFAFEGKSKQFNHISTTFIFGWATKDKLYETDNNEGMEFLDFGYSQSKWVSEQLIFEAAKKGLAIRIFRPALITPPANGGGENLDITIRLLTFMIKHGIGVNAQNQVSFMPADITANNIISIANQWETNQGVFHITRDNIEKLSDITDLITAKTGRNFEKFPIDQFVPEVIRRCSKDDILYPLLDFLIGSVDNITAMEYKLYDSSEYKAARDASEHSLQDPPLEVIVEGILQFLDRNKII